MAADVTLAHLRTIAGFAGLPIGDDRLAQLLPQLQNVLLGLEALDQLDLAEVEPEIVFRAHWEDDHGR